MSEDQIYTIILRHDTSSNWMLNNPILDLGEYGVEDDTHRVKRGDGTSNWESLSYETFGLDFIVTFANLQGKVDDNEELSKALADKVSISVIGDKDSSIVSSISIMSDVGIIGKITKVTKNLSSGNDSTSNVIIQSSDDSIAGVWSIDPVGAKILDLKAVTKIESFKQNNLYINGEFCIHQNKLYSAKRSFTSTTLFDVNNWNLICSVDAIDIKYSNSTSQLSSTNVQQAIDEVVSLLKNKVEKTTDPNKLYGTDESGETTYIDISSIGSSITVNDVHQDPESRNIQIDSYKINYDDSEESKQTVKQVLDSKISKSLFGEEGSIVTNVSVSLDDSTGSVTLTTEHTSLETGDKSNTTSSIDVVSEEELTKQLDELKSELESTITSGLEQKLDKSISDTLVSKVELVDSLQDGLLGIKITSKNVTDSSDITNNILVKSSGELELRVEDNSLVLDSTAIDTKIKSNSDSIDTITGNIQSIEQNMLDKNNFKTNKLLTGPVSIESNDISGIKLNLKQFNTDTSSVEDISLIFKSKSNNINVSTTELNTVDIDVNIENIKINTPNEGVENKTDIVTAIDNLYKLPRITEYTSIKGYNVTPNSMVYIKDTTNNIAYLAVCANSFTIPSESDNYIQDFETNVTNGNLIRIGIPNEII